MSQIRRVNILTLIFTGTTNRGLTYSEFTYPGSHIPGVLPIRNFIYPGSHPTRFYLSTIYISYFFYRYGEAFITNTYLFHLSRVDVQHNFSPYFYVLKQTAGTTFGHVVNRLAFVPQFGIVLWIGARFHEKLPVALLLQTFAFVALNKVSTSQVLQKLLKVI